MTASPTLKKISEHLNISISTVSRALKNHPDVSAETIRRVKELAEFLEYEPNSFAVNLRKRKSNTYAILVPEISGHFYHSFIQSVEEEARSRHFGVLIMATMNDPIIETENLQICRSNHVAGIFIALSSTTTDFTAFLKTENFGIPLVFFDKLPQNDQFTGISIADYDAGAMAAGKMMQSGKAKTWFLLGNPSFSITRLRRSGFMDAWSKLNINYQPELYYAHSEEAAYQTILEKGAEACLNTSILCLSDEILCGVMRALYELKVQIPNDVSILAMSNGLMPKYFNPTISYIETSGYQLGKLSFAAMERKENGSLLQPVTEKLQCQFFEGGSL
jgi:LacI family transcriptional regulator